MKITKLSYKNLIIAILILSVSVTVALSGCGSQKDETGNPVQNTSSDVSEETDVENNGDVEEHKKLTVSNGHFSLSARSFVRLFDATEHNYTYSKMDDDASLFYVLTKTDDSNKRPQNVGMMSFAKDADKALSAKEEGTENIITKINIFVENTDDVQPILAGCMCAADPNLKLNTASDLAEDVVKKAGKNDGYVRNGVNFAVKSDGGYYYIIISIAQTPVTENTTVANAGANVTTHNAGTNTTKPNSGNSTGSKAPSSKADIVAYYNSAINKVYDSKAGFKKTRETVIHSLDGGAILKIQLVVDMINNELGVGTTYWNNSKGNQKYLSRASLTAADLTSATCVDNYGTYKITLNLKNGNSSANGSGSSDSSPLQRAGLCAGKGSKSAYDYKNAENIYAIFNNDVDCTSESATEKVTNAKIVAIIDSKTGKLQSLTASWSWSVEIAKVKYSVVSAESVKENATTTVKLTNVQW